MHSHAYSCLLCGVCSEAEEVIIKTSVQIHPNLCPSVINNAEIFSRFLTQSIQQKLSLQRSQSKEDKNEASCSKSRGKVYHHKNFIFSYYILHTSVVGRVILKRKRVIH